MPSLSWKTAVGSFRPIGSHSSGATIATATTLTPATGATKLLIQALSQNVRFTLDGTAPTATSGFQLKVGNAAVLIILEENVTVIVIQEAATAGLEYQWGQ